RGRKQTNDGSRQLMKRSSSLGLMAFWTDIDANYVLSFQEWHNCEHIPERLSIPGFKASRRYRGFGNAPMFLIYYETETPMVLESAAYLASLNRPTPTTAEALQHFRNPTRNIYKLLAEVGEPPSIAAPYILSMRFNLHSDQEIATRDWYRHDWLPAV